MKITTEIEKMISENKFVYSKHFYTRQTERNLREINVKDAILSGQVIQHTESINRGNKYIIYNEQNNICFHIILIFNNNSIVLKTIYIPNTDIFKPDLKTRKAPL